MVSFEDISTPSRIAKIKVSEIKEQLEAYGLETEGLKADLIERLREHLQSTQETSQKQTETEEEVTEEVDGATNEDIAEAENEEPAAAEQEESIGSKRPAEDAGDGDEASKRTKGEDGSSLPTATSSDAPQHCVWLRGLPWETNKSNIMEFLGEDVTVKKITLKPGNSGEAFIEVASADCVEKALLKDHKHIGKRYVEVFRLSTAEYQRQLQKAGYTDSKEDGDYAGVIRLRGLPWAASKKDVENFFEGIPIQAEGIHIIINKEGRPSGEAYVVFETEEGAKEAMKKDKEKMHGRWLDLFEATKAEVYAIINANQSQDTVSSAVEMEDANYTGVLRLRGIPFEVTKKEIKDFFGEFELEERDIFIVKRPDGRVAGDAFAVFKTEDDARKAESLDKQKLGSRWVDLFPTNKSELYHRVGVAVKVANKPDATVSDVLRMRGLPFQSGVKDVREFFKNFELVENGIYIVPSLEGSRPPGEGFALFTSQAQAEAAMASLNRECIAGRYIELFLVTRGDLYAATTFSPVLSMQGPNAIYDVSGMTCVKLKGLPYAVNESMIFKFFEGLTVIGIFICRDTSGRPSGEGFCEFESLDDCQKAMSRNKESLEDRLVEVYPHSKDDVLSAISEPNKPKQGLLGDGRGRGGRYGGRGYQSHHQPQIFYSQPLMMAGYSGQQGYSGAPAYGGQQMQTAYNPMYMQQQQPVQPQQQVYGYQGGYGGMQQNTRGRGGYRGRGRYGGYNR